MLDQETKGRIAGQISSLTMELNQQMEIREKCAFLEQQLRELEDEQFYFQKYYTDASIKIQNIKPVSADKLLKLWNAFEEMDGGRKITGFWAKLGLCMTYGMWVFKLFRVDPREAVISLQKQYYEAKKEELSGELRTLEELCEKFNFQDKFDQLANNSMMYFKDMIANKYGVSEKRMVFEQTCFHKNSRGFISEYPVILSTTYSIKKCLDKDFIYDYIIVDESSQVDLVTGVLAMSCAKNIVVVGDTRQLPNVITNKEVTVFKKYWREGMAERFNFVTQNLLSSAALTWQCAKSVLLREHYRCSPDIINFCNQKFYNNQLIIMTKEDENNQALKLFKTSEGNHGRGHVNQREIDVIKNEILPEYINSGERDIGIITPYVDQAAAMKAQLPDFCEIDTVHKFQGREKNVIILSSVLNVIDDFVNDPHMINVAVSRAVKSLIVVTSGNKENDKTYYGELARYIEYNNYSIVQSKTYSVFDMLYKEYNQERRKYLARHKRISEWDSENLMYTVIEDVLGNYSDLDCSCHVPLSMIVKDISGLDDRETRYALHPFTHVDFLIFTRIDKTPKLAIEVDGVKFHQEGSTQAERDKRKDHILETIHIPLLRLRTDGSNERQVLDNTLRKIVQGE